MIFMRAYLEDGDQAEHLEQTEPDEKLVHGTVLQGHIVRQDRGHLGKRMCGRYL